MNSEERRFEAQVASAFTDGTPPSLPEGLLANAIDVASQKRRYPRWLADIKEPPMRTDSHLAVGSPTFRVGAILLATVLLAMALAAIGVAGTRLLAADGIIVVDHAGGGHYTTIADAVAAAEDGDEILIKPGTYTESVTISQDITMRGENQDTVIIQAGIGCTDEEELVCPDGTALYPDHWFGEHPYALLLDDTEAELSQMTFELGIASGIIAHAGAPTIRDISFLPTEGWAVLYVHDGSAAKISEADFADGWVFFEEQSPATIEDSRFWAIVANTDNTNRTGGPAWIRDNDAVGIAISGDAVVEGNQVVAPDGETVENGFYGQGIDVQAGNGFVIRENVVSGFAEGSGIALPRGGIGDLADNIVTGNRVGIGIGNLGGSTVVVGNQLVDNETGLLLGTRPHEVVDNTVRGGVTGISLGGASMLEDNDVEGATERGIAILGSTATLRDNRSCGNGENLFVADQADPDIDDSNEFCANGT